MERAVLRLSEQALRSADQAIGFLMQQAVENADCISLAAGLVDEQSLPVDLVRETVGQVLQDAAAGRKLLQYGTTQGPEPLRRVFRDYLAELEQRTDRLTDLPLSQLFLTTGSQQLLALLAQALFNPGDICLVAAPTYFVFLGVLQAVGASIVPVQSDQHGMCPVALRAALQGVILRTHPVSVSQPIVDQLCLHWLASIPGSRGFFCWRMRLTASCDMTVSHRPVSGHMIVSGTL
jgi:2-aminoadipate transaminase